MQPTDSFLLNALLAFAGIYIVLAIIRIVVLWKNTKIAIAANTLQQQNAEKLAAQNSATVDRAEKVLQGKQAQMARSEALWRQAEDTQQRWSAILPRLEALIEKLERRNGA
jgi:uncharacterized protein YaiL (DUF2058 family)